MENSFENKSKPSKTKSLFIFGGLIFGAVASLALLKYSASHLIDEKKLGVELAEVQIKRHSVFKQNDANVTKVLFDKFPEAQTMLMGNLYITGDTFKLFVRPTILQIDNQKAVDTHALDNDGLTIYEVNGDFKNGVASNYKISPWHPELEKRDGSWSWSIATISQKLFGWFLYVLPGMETIQTATNDAANDYVVIGTEAIPFAVYSRPKEKIISSAMFKAEIANTVKLPKGNLSDSPIAIANDEIKCVFRASPEYIKGNRFRLEVKEVGCVDEVKASKMKNISIVGEDGKYGIDAFEDNGTFVIKKGRSLTVIATSVEEVK